jgi:hypothetical protein
LKEILEGIGFEAVSFKRLTNGITVIHMGRKPLTHPSIPFCSGRGFFRPA